MSFDSTALMGFVNLAIDGNQQACSNAQHAAYRLSQVVLDNLPCLDHEAIQGLMEFICAAHAHPQAARELLERK